MHGQPGGRHRAPRHHRVNPSALIASPAVRLRPALTASAVVLSCGTLVASFALPAVAVPGAPAASAAGASASVSALAMAVVAPRSGATPRFGAVDFSAQPLVRTATPALRISLIAPKPSVAPRVSGSTSRSKARSTLRSTVRSAGSRSSSSTARVPAATGGITAIAASLLGIPYVYGGSTPAGFDCSGFTSYVYRQVGKSIPRTAEAQRAASTRVTNPVPGDLVFFGIPASHVGIYAGAGRMYDSPHSGEVTQLRSIYSSTVTYGRF